jgi:hypothetical protein
MSTPSVHGHPGRDPRWDSGRVAADDACHRCGEDPSDLLTWLGPVANLKSLAHRSAFLPPSPVPRARFLRFVWHEAEWRDLIGTGVAN